MFHYLIILQKRVMMLLNLKIARSSAFVSKIGTQMEMERLVIMKHKM